MLNRLSCFNAEQAKEFQRISQEKKKKEPLEKILDKIHSASLLGYDSIDVVGIISADDYYEIENRGFKIKSAKWFSKVDYVISW